MGYEPDLLSAIDAIKPTVLIGVSTIHGAFDETVLRKMAALNPRPIIMPLVQPHVQGRVHVRAGRAWTDGRVAFASGARSRR